MEKYQANYSSSFSQIKRTSSLFKPADCRVHIGSMADKIRVGKCPTN